jgi:hypothetical protein
MDLIQTKLSKSEWESIEIALSTDESRVLKMINDGYADPNIKVNLHISLLSFLKIEYSQSIEYYLYEKYFEKEINAYSLSFQKAKMKLDDRWIEKDKKKKKDQIKLKKSDRIRLENTEKMIAMGEGEEIFEFKQLLLCSQLIKYYLEKKEKEYMFYFYTLTCIKDSFIQNVNKYIALFIASVLDRIQQAIPNIIEIIFQNAYHIMEKNPYLLKYADLALYPHQKELFGLFQQQQQKQQSEDSKMLIMYTSPTGSGKTLSPIGLSVQHRLIYICAARHVGLSLAKSAIHVNKKVAFAFGCESANDIRLHFSAAVEYTRNKKSGAIAKVDNANGTRVEIMICDIGSYLVAMYYMLSFNKESDLILFWDEPTISLDVNSHPLHAIINKNWTNNKISKIVLASATLPGNDDLRDMIDDFRDSFEGGTVHVISSFDCKKTISLLNSTGHCVLPHLLFSDPVIAQSCVRHCEKNKSLLRYMDLREVVRFSQYVENKKLIPEQFYVLSYFKTINEISIMNIKLYYLFLVSIIQSDAWEDLHRILKSTLKSIYMDLPLKKKTVSSDTGILLTSEHAHTLTDGPAIYLADNVEKIGKFLFEQSHIPNEILATILTKIEENDIIRRKMEELTRTLDDEIGEEDKKIAKEIYKPAIKTTMDNIDRLRFSIKSIAIDSVYIPNTSEHQHFWLQENQPNSFVSLMDESSIIEIMQMDLATHIKILLLMGIGIFEKETKKNTKYLELIKRLANQQKLYLIIASSDYIYGTNYQFCHGYIGKDLGTMTQEKIIQSFGRIGRGNIQQDYTIRLRDDRILEKLFLPDTELIEAKNMCRLFTALK